MLERRRNKIESHRGIGTTERNETATKKAASRSSKAKVWITALLAVAVLLALSEIIVAVHNSNKKQQQQHTMSSKVLENPPAIQGAIDHLLSLGINFLAIDFDQTILDIHTGGNWKGSQEELFSHIRPVYAQLIRGAIATNRIEVAVVTFTCQTRFVRGVLDYIFESVPLEENRNMGLIIGNDMVDTSQKIPIRGGDRSWKYSGKGSIDGKQPHMASAVEELEARREDDYQQHKSENSTGASPPEPISRKTTLLLDDDSRNIRHALHNGTRAIWFNPKRPDLLLPELVRLE